MELTLEYAKSTKRKHVYIGMSTDAAIPTLYIDKSALPNQPKAIRVTVEAVDYD